MDTYINTPSNNNGGDSIVAPPINDSGRTGEDEDPISGNVTGRVGEEYSTRWFTFTFNSLETGSTYSRGSANYTASSGNTLVIASITITNTSGGEQPFGTFDWFVNARSLSEPIWPIDPLNNNMMPTDFYLQDGETATYDVVIEYPSNLASPYFTYTEVDEYGGTHATFQIPIP